MSTNRTRVYTARTSHDPQARIMPGWLLIVTRRVGQKSLETRDIVLITLS